MMLKIVQTEDGLHNMVANAETGEMVEGVRRAEIVLDGNGPPLAMLYVRLKYVEVLVEALNAKVVPVPDVTGKNGAQRPRALKEA